MLDWLSDNREWLFSGAGLTTLSGIALLARHVLTRGSPSNDRALRNSSIRGLRVRTHGDVTITTGDRATTSYLASEGSEVRHIRANILSPSEGTITGHHVSVTGRCSPLPAGVKLWLMTQDRLGDLFHPDDGPIAESDGRWMGRASIGNNHLGAQQGMSFQIHLVAAELDTSTKYREYLQRAHKNDAWLGIADLMGGRILATVEVIRDDSVLF